MHKTYCGEVLIAQIPGNMNTRRFVPILHAVFSQFSVPFARILLSLVVVRLYSREFWGEYVAFLLAVSLAATLVNWGSKDYLMRAFSRSPREIGTALADSIAGKLWVTLAISFSLLPLPLPFDKTLLLCWIGGQLSWQIFEPLNQYRRLFLPAAFIELGLILVLVAIVMFKQVTIREFLVLSVAAEWGKGLVYGIMNRAYLSFSAMRWQNGLNFLRDALPFLFLVMTGTIAARGELYVLALKMNNRILAEYQVLSNFIQATHVLASAILLPFIKNLYRLRTDALFKLERRFLTAGLLFTPVLTLFISLVLFYGYAFRIPLPDYVLSAGLIFSYFLYFIRMQVLVREDRIYFLTLVLLAMGLCKVFLSIWLIPGLGMTGALTAGLAAYLLGIVGFWRRGMRATGG